jgi:hypothetical protein
MPESKAHYIRSRSRASVNSLPLRDQLNNHFQLGAVFQRMTFAAGISSGAVVEGGWIPHSCGQPGKLP